ncbi:MAG: hypothetical protein AB7J86_42545 [Vulcanimicrobiota bacterium]
MRFYEKPTGADRRHVLTPEDIEVVLERLPPETYVRLRAIHFVDRSRGGRVLGYVTGGRREISLCALPPRVSLTRFLCGTQSARTFGARRGQQWPELAVRRFMLYDVFLHELGHLQIVDPKARSNRRYYAHETLAQRFADEWRKELWSRPSDHPDPVHDPPTASELAQLKPTGSPAQNANA